MIERNGLGLGGKDQQVQLVVSMLSFCTFGLVLESLAAIERRLAARRQKIYSNPHPNVRKRMSPRLTWFVIKHCVVGNQSGIY
jgi:hypothetical protein